MICARCDVRQRRLAVDDQPWCQRVVLVKETRRSVSFFLLCFVCLFVLTVRAFVRVVVVVVMMEVMTGGSHGVVAEVIDIFLIARLAH